MSLPTYLTHYFEAEYGPFLNICDLGSEQVAKLVECESSADTAFNRFAMEEEFLL